MSTFRTVGGTELLPSMYKTWTYTEKKMFACFTLGKHNVLPAALKLVYQYYFLRQQRTQF